MRKSDGGRNIHLLIPNTQLKICTDFRPLLEHLWAEVQSKSSQQVMLVYSQYTVMCSSLPYKEHHTSYKVTSSICVSELYCKQLLYVIDKKGTIELKAWLGCQVNSRITSVWSFTYKIKYLQQKRLSF